MSGINLMLALSDLKVVQSVIGAMHAADRGAAAAMGGGKTGANVPGPVDHYTPSPKFNPRVVYHPTPRYESRPVLHPTPRLEFQDASRPALQGTTEVHHAAVPMVPPVWKTLPNIPACPAVPQVKIVPVRPDIRHKGTLIDTFI